MKIATWNINGLEVAKSRPRAQRILERILGAEVGADVWVLTESHPIIDLRPAFCLVAESTPAPDRALGERWVAIWVRNDFRAHAVDEYASERTACVRISSPAHLHIYGSVLPWHGDTRFPERGMQAFSKAVAQQEHDWKTLQPPHAMVPLIVAGDLNQDLLKNGHYYGSSERRDCLRDALSSTTLECWTGELRQDGDASVDHICVTKGASRGTPKPETFPKTDQKGRKLSDHFPVAMSLDFA